MELAAFDLKMTEKGSILGGGRVLKIYRHLQ